MLSLVFVTSFLGGFLPLINADAVLLGAALLAPRGSALPLIAVAVTGQVAGKLVFFLIAVYAGETALRLLGRRADRVRSVATTPCASAGVIVSAAVGLPPFFITTFLAAGARMPVLHFCGAALCGRTVRTVVLVLAPHLITGL
jgi:membrane protein YqaA with SNARE-associated domain